nr:hypothetical protein [Tanacetum cinerariifolium]
MDLRTADDEVAPWRNAIRTFKVPDQYLLTTRTMDDEAPGLKAIFNDEVTPRRNAIRTFEVPDQYLLTTRTVDDEAPGLKALKVRIALR